MANVLLFRPMLVEMYPSRSLQFYDLTVCDSLRNACLKLKFTGCMMYASIVYVVAGQSDWHCLAL